LLVYGRRSKPCHCGVEAGCAGALLTAFCGR
jgi:hypothetical protein